jgi:RimJ/RimL family protein N-acetyltransferase
MEQGARVLPYGAAPKNPHGRTGMPDREVGGSRGLAEERERVRLRGASPEDAPRVTRLLEGDTELALRTAMIPIPYTMESAEEFLAQVDPQLVLAIVVADQLVGMAGMTGAEEPVEIGYWIGRPYWGRGFATAAVALLMEEARRRGIRHLAADVFPDNTGSARVLEKSGFARQGEIQKDLPKRGGLRTLIRYCWEERPDSPTGR